MTATSIEVTHLEEIVGDIEGVTARLFDPTEWTADGCLVRNRYRDAKGYTYIKVKGKTWKAHRLAWTLTNGAIPDGMTIDHLCESAPCVNVFHMEVVSASENSVRRHWRGGRCKNGHDVTIKENVVLWGERRQFRRCRLCWNAYQREFRGRSK